MSEILSVEIGNITTSVISESMKTPPIVFESRTKKTEDKIIDSSIEYFEMDNQKYIVGYGSYENNIYKFDKENFKQLLHYAIAKVAKSEKTKLITSIPASQFNAFADEMKKVILENKEVSVKIKEGQTKNITIEEVAILPEGYSIFKTTPKHNLISKARTIIIDIGGGTVELIEFDEDGKYVDGDSINNEGLLALFDKAQLDIQVKKRKMLKIEEVRKFLDGKLNILGMDNYDSSEVITNFGEELINTIFGKKPYILDCNVIVVGGGASKFKGVIESKIPQAYFNTDITSLCSSNLKVAMAKWRR